MSELTARDLKIRLIDDEEIHVTLASSVSELMEAGGMTTEVEVTRIYRGTAARFRDRYVVR
jgi:hypothetical protein